MDCRSVFERWHLASANQRVALWTVCWYVLSSQDHCHNPPSHIHNVSSSSSTCNTKTEIQSYTYTNENVFLNIRSKALYSDRRIFRFKSSTCGYEENSEMLMWKKIRWSTHTRAIALTLSQISSKSGMSPWSHMILIAAKAAVHFNPNQQHPPLLRIRRASQHLALNKQTQQMCSGAKPTQSRWKFFSLKWATYIYRQF